MALTQEGASGLDRASPTPDLHSMGQLQHIDDDGKVQNIDDDDNYQFWEVTLDEICLDMLLFI